MSRNYHISLRGKGQIALVVILDDVARIWPQHLSDRRGNISLAESEENDDKGSDFLASDVHVLASQALEEHDSLLRPASAWIWLLSWWHRVREDVLSIHQGHGNDGGRRARVAP